MSTDTHWSLNKQVPIAIIIVLVIQFIGGVFAVGWITANINNRIDAVELNVARLDGAANVRDDQVRDNTTNIAVMKETLSNIDRTVNRIEDKLNEQP